MRLCLFVFFKPRSLLFFFAILGDLQIFIDVAVSCGYTSIGTIFLWIFLGHAFVLMVHAKIRGVWVRDETKVSFHPMKDCCSILFHPFLFVFLPMGLSIKLVIDHVRHPILQKQLRGHLGWIPNEKGIRRRFQEKSQRGKKNGRFGGRPHDV